MVQITDLRLKNFLPYAGEVFLSFPTDEYVNTTIFFGENTKGKTSILHAVRWVLYGIATDKGQELTYENLLNYSARDRGETEVAVEMNFLHDQDLFWLRRELTGTEASSAGFLRMTKNGQPVGHDEAARTIENIAPAETQRFFLFDGELLREYEELMVPSNHTAKKIKKAIEDVMGFPSLLKAQTVLEKVKKKLATDSKAERSANDALVQLQNERDRLEESIELKVEEYEEVKDSYDLAYEEEKALIAAINSQSKDKAKFDELNNLQGVLESLKQQCKEKDQNLAEIRKDAWKSILKQKVQDESNKNRNLESQRQQIQSDLKNLEVTKAHLREIESTGTCPMCGSEPEVGEAFAQKFHQLEADSQRIKDSLENIPEPNSLWVSLEPKFANSSQEKDLKASEREKQSLLVQRESIGQQIKALVDDLRDFDGDEADRLVRRKAVLTLTLQELVERNAELERVLDKLRADSLRIQQEINKFNFSGEITKESQLLVVKETLQLVDKAKEKLRDRIRSRVEEAATKAFTAMTNRPDDYKELRITEGYGLEILASDGRVIPKRSAGAEQVVALALIDGLNNVGSSPGPVLMDTPFGRLDLTHRANILGYMPKSASQFIVFTHSGELDENSPALTTVMPYVGKRYKIESLGPWESRIVEQ
jgi:DNA sulfur modification protein DndD